MTESEKRKIQWRDASRRRKETIKTYKLSNTKKYTQVRAALSRSKRKIYSKKANAGTSAAKLARYHRTLNKFDKKRRLLAFKMKTTRNRSLNVAIKKASRNKEDSKALELLADLSNLQKENYFLYQPVNK